MPVGGVGFFAQNFWDNQYWDDQYWTGVGSPIFLVPFIFLAMPARRVAFVMPPLESPAVADTMEKNPQEIVDATFDMSENVPQGAAVATANVYASRKANANPSIPDLTTSLSSGASADATSVSLGANPGVGAYLLINPSGTNEELVLVIAVSGTGPFTATVDPALANPHISGEQVTYEPGQSSLVLASTTASLPSANVLGFRAQRGVSGRTYRFFFLGNLDTGAKLRGELLLSITET